MANIVKTVLIVLAVLIVLYLILNIFFKKSTDLTGMHKTSEGSMVIQASELANSDNTSNYTYSMWFYVDNWSVGFNSLKPVLERVNDQGELSPGVYLGAMENDIIIKVSCYPTNNNGQVSKQSIEHQCTVKNFPLQSWVNCIISMYGRTLDVYIDGKLVRTCVLPGVARTDHSAPIKIMGGKNTSAVPFSGYIANFQYWDEASNPQQAYNIYKAGFGGSWLSNLFNKYRIKVSFLEDNKEKASFEI